MKQLVLDIALPAAPTLDNFVPGRNAELVAALYALANGAGKERFIYLWGADGSGRSHLLRAVAGAARDRGRRTVWIDAGTGEIDAAGDVLCAVDDVHLFGAEAQIALFNLHNGIRSGTGVLLVSGNAAPAQLALRADLVTRLAAGLVYQLHGLGARKNPRRCAAMPMRAACGSRRRSPLTCCATRGVTCRRCLRCSMRSTAIRSRPGARSRCRCCGSCSKPPQKQVETADQRR